MSIGIAQNMSDFMADINKSVDSSSVGLSSPDGASVNVFNSAMSTSGAAGSAKASGSALPGGLSNVAPNSRGVSGLTNALLDPSASNGNPALHRALASAMSSSNSERALKTLEGVVSSDLFQGKGFEGVLNDDQLNDVRELLLDIFSLMTKNGNAGSSATSGASTGFSGLGNNGSSTANAAAGTASRVPNVPQQTPGKGHQCENPGMQGKQSGQQDEQEGKKCDDSKDPNNSHKKPSNGKTGSSSSPTGSTSGKDKANNDGLNGGLAEIEKLLNKILTALSKTDKGQEKVQDFVNMLNKFIKELSTGVNNPGDSHAGGSSLGSASPQSSLRSQTDPATTTRSKQASSDSVLNGDSSERLVKSLDSLLKALVNSDDGDEHVQDFVSKLDTVLSDMAEGVSGTGQASSQLSFQLANTTSGTSNSTNKNVKQPLEQTLQTAAIAEIAQQQATMRNSCQTV